MSAGSSTATFPTRRCTGRACTFGSGSSRTSSPTSWQSCSSGASYAPQKSGRTKRGIRSWIRARGPVACLVRIEQVGWPPDLLREVRSKMLIRSAPDLNRGNLPQIILFQSLWILLQSLWGPSQVRLPLHGAGEFSALRCAESSCAESSCAASRGTAVGRG